LTTLSFFVNSVSLVYTIYFSSIVKQAFFRYVNQTRIRYWNQPVLSN